MPSGGVDFAGATVSIAIGGSETSLVLTMAAYGRLAMTRGSPVSSRMCTPVLARSTM
jgi:hypothetical protein